MCKPGEPQLSCDFCTRQISRREHLTRHLSSHVNQRQYQCGALTRIRAKARQSRMRSACDNCAKAKLRCSPCVPCTRCQQKGLSSERDDGFPAGHPKSPPGLIQEQESQDDANGEMMPELVPFSTPPFSVGKGRFVRAERRGICPLTILENCETAPSPREMHASHDAYNHIRNWFLPSCTPLQGLSMDFLDYSMFPVSDLQFDPDGISELQGTAAGQVNEHVPANHFLRCVGHPTGPALPDPSDSWHTYSGSGMVQENLWNKSRSPEAIEPDHCPNRADTSRKGSQGHSRSVLNLLSLGNILAMEDHGHVAKVQPNQVEELSSFIKGQHPRTSVYPSCCRELLENPQVINAFVQLYFEHFHSTLPLLHRSTFNVSEVPPLLLLAVATIGSRFSKISQAHTLSTVMGEILRKAIDNIVGENIHETIQIPFAQAAVLNQIQMAYRGSRQLALKAQFQRSMLMTVCRGLSSRMCREEMPCNFPRGTNPQNPVVSSWLDRELSRRLTYAIWLIDCQFSLNTSVPPMMSLEDLDPCLPCHETLWDLGMASLSEELTNSHECRQPVRLREALNTPKLADILRSRELGLFARSIIMTAVFYQWHTATSVDRYILQSATDDHVEQCQAQDPLLGNDLQAGCAVTTPGPLLARLQCAQLRTAACEAISSLCKDSNTWPASDSCHLMKLYHHISILLIVPLQPMCDHIGWTSTKDCIVAAREKLCSWLRADIQNARRAVMHAIALFCLVRRRKSGAHSENHHLFVAFLTIWTFFSLDPVARSKDGSGDGQWGAPVCSVDWDGQMDLTVQETWIQAPGHPTLRVAGVGSLDEPNGIHRILVETHCILLSDRMWGIGQLFAGVLEGLISRGTAINVI
ncbi:fungal-specific transcription factor domain-containing protein [Aspergillus pseudonomiae]|nr:fungal-specific transcription factor domain-containing protein [Aspergillus pseudonomiae]